jgi:hypothetical protein
VWYAFWWVLIPVGILATLLGVWFATTEPVFSRNYFYYSVPPTLFTLATFSFLTLNEVTLAQHIAIGISLILSSLYFHNVLVYHYNYDAYNDKSIENVANYSNLITFFVTCITLFAASTLVGVPFGVLVTVLFVVTTLILFQSLWSAGLSSIKALVYVAVVNIIVLEVFWAVAFLPTDFYVSGFLVTMSFYTSWGIFKSNLYSILTPKLLARYIYITAITLILAIATTVWY